MSWMSWKRRLCVYAAIAAMVLSCVLIIVYAVARGFVNSEREVRTAWEVDVGELLGRDEALGLDLALAPVESNLTVLQLVPAEVEEEGFTYYDVSVQDRLAQSLEKGKGGRSWTAEAPLAVLDPFGTGSNSLYLYFETDLPTQVSYTVHVDDPDIPDFTAAANSTGGREYARSHEFQLIGLVPGEENQVTLTVTGFWGAVRQRVSFTIDMPDTHSGYPARLEYTDGESAAALSEGLFAMMRTNGYLGYGFFFDNAGVMRYEMVLEGFGLDRALFVDGDLVTCVSAAKLARIDPLGRVEQVYPLEGYELHHDIVLGPEDGTVIALVDKEGSETIEDVVVEIDLETGAVTELIDFSRLMEPYFSMTHAVAITDEFFWQAGQWDWLHLNTVDYLEEGDSLIVSSRETSTIIKVENVHTDPALAWFAGDPAFWADTPYAGLCLEPAGEFVYQYGQHSVEYAGPGETEGVYYIRTFNNNYWSNSSRDGYEPELDPGVGTGLYDDGDDQSWVYVYEIDENAGTFALAQSFPVPYSSIVSNAAPAAGTDNWVVNSGVANVYGEYDAGGTLIRQFAYQCSMQGYRTFKLSMAGFWFAGEQ